MSNKIRVNIYISEDLKNKANEIAGKMGINFSSFVSLAIYKMINDKDNDKIK